MTMVTLWGHAKKDECILQIHFLYLGATRLFLAQRVLRDYRNTSDRIPEQVSVLSEHGNFLKIKHTHIFFFYASLGKVIECNAYDLTKG